MSVKNKMHKVFVSVAAGLSFAYISPIVFGASAAPDLASKTGITIGGAVGGAGGKFVPWGGSVVLNAADGFAQSNGKCAFNISYDLENIGNASTSVPFKNWLRVNDATVAINSNLSVEAGHAKQIATQAYLAPGSFALVLQIDAENAIYESAKTNNLAYVKVTLNGTCGTSAPPPVSKADVTSLKGITFGATTGGAGGKFVPWGGSIVLSAADAAARGSGKCGFNAVYDLENQGAAATATPFKNVLRVNDAIVGTTTGLTLDAGQAKQIYSQLYLSPGEVALVLQVDADNNVSESSEVNNLSYVKLTLTGACTEPATPPPAPKADLVSQKGITIAGKFVPWGGNVVLHAADASIRSANKCVFGVEYDVENIGTGAASTTFVDALYSGSALAGQQTVSSLGAGQARNVSTQIAIAAGVNHLYLLLDANKNIDESNESNNATYVSTTVDSSCGTGTTTTTQR